MLNPTILLTFLVTIVAVALMGLLAFLITLTAIIRPEPGVAKAAVKGLIKSFQTIAGRITTFPDDPESPADDEDSPPQQT